MLIKNLSKLLVWMQSCVALVIASDLKMESDYVDGSPKASHYIQPSPTYLGSGAVAVCEDLRRDLNSGALNQGEVNERLKDAIRNDRKYLVEFLLNLLEGLRPDQNGVNQALVYAVKSNKLAMLELLLNRPVGQLRPDQEVICTAYDEVSDNFCYIAPEDPRYSLMKETIAMLSSKLKA